MSGRGEALTPESEATLRALAEAKVGRCHRCAYLRQEHRDGMGHRAESQVGVRAEVVLALLDEAAAAREALPSVEEMAAALHSFCTERWRRKAERDPGWQGTQHGPDAHRAESEDILAALRAARASDGGR